MGAREDALLRFRHACQRDPSVVAAFVGGSIAAHTDDEVSDVDLYAVTRCTSAARRARAGPPGRAYAFSRVFTEWPTRMLSASRHGLSGLASIDRSCSAKQCVSICCVWPAKTTLRSWSSLHSNHVSRHLRR